MCEYEANVDLRCREFCTLFQVIPPGSPPETHRKGRASLLSLWKWTLCWDLLLMSRVWNCKNSNLTVEKPDRHHYNNKIKVNISCNELYLYHIPLMWVSKKRISLHTSLHTFAQIILYFNKNLKDRSKKRIVKWTTPKRYTNTPE